MKNIVVLTGAGMSAESGLKTFRDHGGLWEQYDIMEVASIEGWRKNPSLVLQFYNDRRSQLSGVKPNAAHEALVKLEAKYQVEIITQNVDDLHERAGSSNVLHLHGSLLEVKSDKSSSTIDGEKIKRLEAKDKIEMGNYCDQGKQIRPNIVWFGEEVPAMVEASKKCRMADILIIVGTSLQVYPAAGLVHEVPRSTMKYLIDPILPEGMYDVTISLNIGTAVECLPTLVNKLLENE